MMSDDLYRKIQRQLDRYSIGFPETESGVEIEILRFLLNEEEALIFSMMTESLESTKNISVRTKRPALELSSLLESMAQKGLLYRTRKDGEAKYCAAPFIHGLLEFQGRDMPKKLVELTGRYIKEKLKHNMAGESGMRVLPVGESVEAGHRIASYDDAYQILNAQELIVVADCSCRLQYKQFDRACAAPMETCLMMGHMAEYYLENRMGRQIDLNEAMKIIKTSRDHGLVTQTPSIHNPIMICNCCKCCCGFLGAVRRTAKPSELVFSNHLCRVEASKCTGCELCLDRCLVKAISMNVEKVAEINPVKCIGCGLCMTSCQDDAMILSPKPEDQHSKPGEIKSAFTFYDFKV